MAEPGFNTERHVKYYLRCLKTFLPTAYISNDSNRMLLAYLTLSGLDVLGVLQSKTTPGGATRVHQLALPLPGTLRRVSRVLRHRLRGGKAHKRE